MSLHENDLANIIAVVEGATDAQLNKVQPATPTTGSNPVEMTLQGGNRPNSFAWSFGGDGTSTDPSTTHVFSAPPVCTP